MVTKDRSTAAHRDHSVYNMTTSLAVMGELLVVTPDEDERRQDLCGGVGEHSASTIKSRSIRQTSSIKDRTATTAKSKAALATSVEPRRSASRHKSCGSDSIRGSVHRRERRSARHKSSSSAASGGPPTKDSLQVMTASVAAMRAIDDPSTPTASTQRLSSMRADKSNAATAELTELATGSAPQVSLAAPVKQVRFSTVHVREYALTLGDHPQPEAYPVSLDWRHADDIIVSVDRYRQNSPASPGTLHMTKLERRQRLATIMGVAPIELTIQEEQRQSRERELEVLSCPFGDDEEDDDDEEYDYSDHEDDGCIGASFDTEDDDIDSCCSFLSDDESDNSDIILLADAPPRHRPTINLDKSYSPSKRKGSIVIDWNNTWGNDSFLEDFERKDYFDSVNASLAPVPIL